MNIFKKLQILIKLPITIYVYVMKIYPKSIEIPEKCKLIKQYNVIFDYWNDNYYVLFTFKINYINLI